MRVKITKTVNLDDVPYEFDAIVGDCAIRTSEICNDIDQVRIEEGFDAARLINSIRERLVLVDANLEDALGMLEGYRKIVAGANNAVSNNPTEQPVQD